MDSTDVQRHDSQLLISPPELVSGEQAHSPRGPARTHNPTPFTIVPEDRGGGGVNLLNGHLAVAKVV